MNHRPTSKSQSFSARRTQYITMICSSYVALCLNMMKNRITPPNLVGKFIKGSGSDGVTSDHPALGGGKTNITLTADQVPLREHTHDFQIHYRTGKNGWGGEQRINGLYESSTSVSGLLDYSSTSQGAKLSGSPSVNPLVIDIPSYIPSQSVIHIMYVGTNLGSACLDNFNKNTGI